MGELEECCVCGRDDVKLLYAIFDKDVKRICERCAAVDDSIILIKKPTAEQLKEAERPFTVYERLRRAARLRLHKDELELRNTERRKEAQINLTKLAAIKNDEGFMKKQEERKQMSLSEDFNGQIQNARNLKGISQKQLADEIAEPEESIRLIERGIMPQNAENMLKKIEQYLKIDLRKKPIEQSKNIDFKSGNMTVADLKKMREEMFGRKD